MEEFLKKIKLIQDFQLKLNISSSDFIKSLKENVEESDINNIISELFEVFSSNEKEYKGFIDNRGFHIRKKRKLFKKSRTSINAKGTIRNNGDNIIINTSVRAFSKNKIIAFAILFICYNSFIIYQVWGIDTFNNLINNLPVFFIIVLLFIPFIIWFSLKYEVSKMKKELEKQFQLMSYYKKTEV